ncbi:unnamed protein product, partial [Prunus brigantina]
LSQTSLSLQFHFDFDLTSTTPLSLSRPPLVGLGSSHSQSISHRAASIPPRSLSF